MLDQPQSPFPGFFADTNARTESYFAASEASKITRALIEQLRSRAEQTRKNIRLCLHKDPSAALQEMIILQWGNSFFPPKMHPHKAKSFLALDGELAVCIFNDSGVVQKIHVLDPDQSCILRIEAGIYHADIPVTAQAIHLETTSGPFQRETDRIVPPWAPAIDDPKACEALRARLLARVREEGPSCDC